MTRSYGIDAIEAAADDARIDSALNRGGCVPDAVQRERACASGAPLIRDRREGGVCSREDSVRNGPRKSGSPDLRKLSADLG